jgi:2-polyprenyl-3-methyl-5-hydroxy-6-metoxy-1,4-benzoquinol methylase
MNMSDMIEIFKGLNVYDNFNPIILELYAGEYLVLDIGCGSGALGMKIKEREPRAIVYGIDNSKDAAVLAQKRLNRFYLIDLDNEALPYFDNQFDLIILGDVLEHLKSPDIFLGAIRQYLKPEGSILLSVPNIAHMSIRKKLLLGRFEYTETGIIDRTHLRFFTYDTITRLIDACGFQIAERRFISSRLHRWESLLYRLVSIQFVFKLIQKPSKLQTD